MRPIIFVLGTRAQLVKVAPVLQTAVRNGLKHQIWFTGQHRESIDDLVRNFDLENSIELTDQHRERSSIGQLVLWLPRTFFCCYRQIRALRKQESLSPLVIVHGDTLSTFVGALAGRLAGAEIVHLESGLSSGRLFDPFPEELLRRLTFQLTRYALCPNEEASVRMQRFRNCEVVNTEENTLLDCVRLAVRVADPKSAKRQGGYFVASIHRFGNIYSKERLQKIVNELISITEFGGVKFVLHPPTERQLLKYGLWDTLFTVANIQPVHRMPYTDFLTLIDGSRGVLTDGGSNQEELSYLGVPTVLYRDRSERPDGLNANITLRSSFDCSIREYIAAGKFDGLRRPAKVDSDAQPSDQSVAAIARWAA